ncbi:2-dehydropantoate 2-reductase [Couchioplanes caeruleus]|uniref:2-dehydropantoate 2-reductase n=2 Tax=Couchioplanes caeruleus TaxID=56438 RepID=A0A1K0FJ99_9ACTN|nr:2-dehydropantoate 2-reductase [Couchioplanes caeruleus]OJF12800.1 2-dehydropantoate 2-reductase [Couchioplanes caeruleus subsp. caeruleus]ROP33980.1 ketopantoate reductase [Couchioplanes caeruleus]
MRFAVIGAGGLGGYLGGRLAGAGHDVTLIARGSHLAALRAAGLTVIGVDGAATVTPVRATDDPTGIGAVDAVLLAVKTWQLDEALAALPPLAGPDTAVITVQNGVEAPHRVAQAVGRHAVMPGVAKVIAMLAGPGTVRHAGGPGALDLAEWDNRPTGRAERIREALVGAGITTTPPADIWADLWAKFLFVVPSGGLGAVTDATFGVLRQRPGTRRILQAAMAEIEGLARAHGVALPADIVARTMAFVDQQPAEGTTSLHRDIKAGRRSELDAWTGAVVRLGARTGTPTPVHDVIHEVLSLRESGSASA